MKVEINPKVHEELVKNCDAHHRVIVGGRGRGASWSIARILLTQGMISTHFIVCVREFQNSMADSVKLLLEGQIKLLGMESFYSSTRTEIRGINGTKFRFYGLQDHSVDKIKSLEGATICWVAEAQSISRRSVDTLRPTIRTPGSVVWWDLNPTNITDAVYVDFVATDHPPPSTAVCWTSIDDNPWASDVMKTERASDYARDPIRAGHIWEGKLRESSEEFVFSLPIVESAMKRPNPPVSGEIFIGADIAHRGGDEIVFYAVNQDGVVGAKFARNQPANITRETLSAFADLYDSKTIIIDKGDIGKGIADEIKSSRPDLVVHGVDFGGKPFDNQFKNRATEMYWNLRKRLDRVSIPNDNVLRDQLVARRWTYLSSSEGERIMIESKKDIHTTPGWKSPDRADALVLAFSLLDPHSGTSGEALGFSIL